MGTGRQLSEQEIKDLISLDKNSELVSKHAPAFSKLQTLDIIDSVSDGLTLSKGGEFEIEYVMFKGKREFIVQPVKGIGQYFTFPMGRFMVEDTLRRLHL